MPAFAIQLKRAIAIAVAMGISLTPSLLAQVTTGPDGRTVTPRDTSHAAAHKTLFTSRDAMLAGGFVALTFAMFPLDKHIAQELQREDLQNNKLLDNPARNVELITSPGSLIIGGSLYVIGKVGHYKDVADLGWHGTEAVLIATGVTNILKGTLGRARPFVTGDTNPYNFSLLRGFGRGISAKSTQGVLYGVGDFQSFPSGHTSTAFAAASAVTSEARRVWPKSMPYVATVMYGGATLVGLSRMYHNNHWASDVVLGAAIGTFSGLKVVRYSHAHPDNKLDHFILGASIFPSPGGGTLSFTVPAPDWSVR
jgi:membrane-associated phospholipid phosphatase